MLPAMAVAFAAAPIAGQNFGARKPDRVRETFNVDRGIEHRDHAGAHRVLPVRLAPAHAHVHARRRRGRGGRDHAHDHLVELRGERHHLQLLVDVPGAGQHVADDRLERHPAVRVHRAGDLAVAAAGFELEHVWYLSVCSMFLQAIVSLTLVRREFAKRLGAAGAGMGTVPPVLSKNG